MDGQTPDSTAPALIMELDDVDVDVDDDVDVDADGDVNVDADGDVNVDDAEGNVNDAENNVNDAEGTVNDAEGNFDDAESVMSDLSTDEFAKNLKADFKDAMNITKTINFPPLSLHTLPHPSGGVSVEGVGDIKMPLEEAQAQQIAARNDDSFSAYGDDDEVAAGIAASLVFLPNEFTLDAKIWPNIIQGLLGQAARDFGITVPLIAEPWAMAFLSKGYTYSHNDFMSPLASVGNLAIFLPSRHEGGEIVVGDGETERVVFSPSQTAQTFRAKKSEIKMRPIKSGSLWILLCAVHRDAHLEMRPLRHTLRRWTAKDIASRSQDAIYFPLQGNYGEMFLWKRQLKGEDLHRVQQFQSLSQKIPIEIFLVLLSDITDEVSLHRGNNQSRKYEASIYGLDDGDHIATHSIIADDQIIASNTKPPRSAIAIIPRDAVVSHFLKGVLGDPQPLMDNIESLFINYGRACLKPKPHPNAFFVFKTICVLMRTPAPGRREGYWASLMLEGRELLNLLEALLVVGCHSWAIQFGRTYAPELPTSIFLRLRRWLAIGKRGDEKRLEATEDIISTVILEYPRPAQQLKAVKWIINIEQATSINGRPRPRLFGIPGYILPFIRRVLKACIETCGDKQPTAQDGQVLAGFSLYFDDPFAILSLIKDKIGLERQPAAILGLIHKVDHYGEYGYLPREEALTFSRSMVRSLIASAPFVQWRGIADGHYFKKSEEDFDMNDFDFGPHDDGNEYGDYDAWGYGDETQHSMGDWDEYERYMEQSEMEDDMHDEYDENEFNYANHYRTCLYMDRDDLRKAKMKKKKKKKEKKEKKGTNEKRHENLYGVTQSSTFSLSGFEEKGVHYRSLYCLFEQLLRPADQPDDVLKLLVSAIVDIAPQIPHTEFDTLWIPLTKEFIPAVNAGGLIGHFRKSIVSTFISAILKAYVNTWVGQYPRAGPGVDCSCPDCKGLNVFLANHRLRVGLFKADRTRAQHIVDEMTRAKVDFTSDVIEDAESSTLIVTKTIHLLQARMQWGNRRYYASRQVAKFGLTGLELVFGTEWTSFLSMAHLGGVGFDNLEIRTLLGMNTGLSKRVVKAKSATMFFRGLPRASAVLRARRLTEKKERLEAETPSPSEFSSV